MPKKGEEPKVSHNTPAGESCEGIPVIEYSDSAGKHEHCAACGYWGLKK
ncbi:MAG: hypothetical protein HYY67_01725 [Thaumarchaeota archaeon]|nr:hypothetical protein [Nitrososphaerota archaeon]MCS4537565.1 hypothetical protein [Nitrososphaerota archaeon]